MAVKKDMECKIIIKVENGVTSAGKTAYVQRSFININPAINDADVLDIGTKLAALQTHTLSSVHRQDSAEIAAQA